MEERMKYLKDFALGFIVVILIVYGVIIISSWL
jgi:hypothetical protein